MLQSRLKNEKPLRWQNKMSRLLQPLLLPPLPPPRPEPPLQVSNLALPSKNRELKTHQRKGEEQKGKEAIDPDLASSLHPEEVFRNALNSFYCADFHDAVRQCSKLLAKHKPSQSLDGKQRWFLAEVMAALGVLHLLMGRAAESGKLHTAALRARRSALGPSHPVVAVSMNNLGCSYVKQHQLDKAVAVFQSVLKLLSSGSDSSGDSGSSDAETSREDDRSDSGREKGQGEGETDEDRVAAVVAAANNLSSVYMSKHDFDNSFKLLKESLRMQLLLGRADGDNVDWLCDLLDKWYQECRQQAQQQKASGRGAASAPAKAVEDQTNSERAAVVAKELAKDDSMASPGAQPAGDSPAPAKSAQAPAPSPSASNSAPKQEGAEGDAADSSASEPRGKEAKGGKVPSETERRIARLLQCTQSLAAAMQVNMARTINNVAVLFMRNNAYTAAETLFNAVKDVVLDSSAAHDTRQGRLFSLTAATALQNIAHLALRRQEYSEAISKAKLALKLKEELLGKKHEGFALTAHTLAEVYLAAVRNVYKVICCIALIYVFPCCFALTLQGDYQDAVIMAKHSLRALQSEQSNLVAAPTTTAVKAKAKSFGDSSSGSAEAAEDQPPQSAHKLAAAIRRCKRTLSRARAKLRESLLDELGQKSRGGSTSSSSAVDRENASGSGGLPNDHSRPVRPSPHMPMSRLNHGIGRGSEPPLLSGYQYPQAAQQDSRSMDYMSLTPPAGSPLRPRPERLQTSGPMRQELDMLPGPSEARQAMADRWSVPEAGRPYPWGTSSSGAPSVSSRGSSSAEPQPRDPYSSSGLSQRRFELLEELERKERMEVLEHLQNLERLEELRRAEVDAQVAGPSGRHWGGPPPPSASPLRSSMLPPPQGPGAEAAAAADTRRDEMRHMLSGMLRYYDSPLDRASSRPRPDPYGYTREYGGNPYGGRPANDRGFAIPPRPASRDPLPPQPTVAETALGRRDMANDLHHMLLNRESYMDRLPPGSAAMPSVSGPMPSSWPAPGRRGGGGPQVAPPAAVSGPLGAAFPMPPRHPVGSKRPSPTLGGDPKRQRLPR